LTSSRLVLYKEYTPYRSRYTFYKVEWFSLTQGKVG
jgi:hypothetical protein